MTQHNSEHEKSNANAYSLFVEEMEKFIHQAQISRKLSKEEFFIAQEFERIYVDLTAARAEQAALLKQMDRLITQLNSPVIAVSHKKPDPKKPA